MSTTAPYNASEKPGRTTLRPLAATAVIYAGNMVATNASGYALAATDAANLRLDGRAEETIDNSAGAAGDLSIKSRSGVYLYKNSATDPLTIADIGKPCFVEAPDTVAKETTNSLVAGVVHAITDEGVWVDQLFVDALTPVASVVDLTSTNGTAAAASANLAGLAAEAEKIGDDVRAIHAALVARGILTTT